MAGKNLERRRELYRINRDKVLKQNKQYQASKKGRYAEYRKISKSRGIQFNLSYEEFISFWDIPCYYCGCFPDNIGLDRVDNDIGYIMENIVSCCKICNRMKSNLKQEQFINKCKLINENTTWTK